MQRTIEVDLRKNGFLKFLYYTDFETLDPSLESDPTWASTHCNKYYYTGRASSCTDIQWITNDLVNGPYAHQRRDVYHRYSALHQRPDGVELAGRQ